MSDSYLNIDQEALDEWHDDGGAVFEALEPLGIDQAVVTGRDGVPRLVVRRDEHGEPVRRSTGESADPDVEM